MDLTALSQTARKVIILIIVGVLALITIRIAYTLVVSFVKSVAPPTTLVANQLFGSLAPIKFDQPTIASSKFTYSLETVDSKLPAFPALFNVYQLKQTPSLFQSLAQGKNRALGFGFKGEPTSISPSIYQWQDSSQPGYTFTLDIVSGDFHLSLNPSARSDLLQDKLNFDSLEATNKAKQYLSNHQSFSPSFEKGESQIQFLNITPKQTTQVNSAGQANAFRVDFYPSAIDKYPILNQKPESTLLNVTILAGSSDSQPVVYEVNYQQFETDLETKGTYNIKGAQQAWEELNSGKAVVVKNSKLGGVIAINNIYLGYFKESRTKYLKPIYIFDGSSSVDLVKNDFRAILPAIAVENKTQ